MDKKIIATSRDWTNNPKVFGKGKISPIGGESKGKLLEELRELVSKKDFEKLALRMKNEGNETIMHVAMLVGPKETPSVRGAAALALQKAQKIGVDVSGVKKMLENAVPKDSTDVTESLIALLISRM